MSEVQYKRKYLTMPGMKPSDFYLYTQVNKQFNFKLRDVCVLGLRMIYACAGGGITREQMLNMISSISQENLDYENKEDRPHYYTLEERLRS